MYKVMLVNDKALELDQLAQCVDWQAMGFIISDTADSKNDAVKKIKRKKPDVLFIDIQMPDSQGAQLAHTVYNDFPDILMVFTSRYNKLKYVRLALSVCAAGYLIKPPAADEVCQTLEDILVRIDKTHPLPLGGNGVGGNYAISEWLRYFYDHSDKISSQNLTNSFPNPFAEVQDFYITALTISELTYLFSIDDNKYFTISGFQDLLQELAVQTSGVMSAVRETKYVLITAENPSTHISYWKSQNPGMQEFITVSTYFTTVTAQEIPGTLRKLFDFCGRYVYREGPGQIAVYSEEYMEIETAEFSPNLFETIFSELIEAINNEDTMGVESILTKFYSHSDASDLHNQTMNLLDRIYDVPSIPASTAKSFKGEKRWFFSRLLWIESIALLKIVVTNHITSLTLDIARVKGENVLEVLAGQVNAYLNDNYYKAFTIDELANAVNYSPNYLRKVYKQHTGFTVLEAVTNLRMKSARELLSDSKLTIREISGLVGYTNPSYFCSQFQKHHSISPQQYRLSSSVSTGLKQEIIK